MFSLSRTPFTTGDGVKGEKKTTSEMPISGKTVYLKNKKVYEILRKEADDAIGRSHYSGSLLDFIVQLKLLFF